MAGTSILAAYGGKPLFSEDCPLCGDYGCHLWFRPALGCPRDAAKSIAGQSCGAFRADASAFLAAVQQPLTRSGSTIPDKVISLPLERKRLAERGAGQSALFAEVVARDLGDNHSAFDLPTVGDTPLPLGRHCAAPLRNARGAFACTESPKGLRIAIVDEVMTRGTTMSEAARVLMSAVAAVAPSEIAMVPF